MENVFTSPTNSMTARQMFLSFYLGYLQNHTVCKLEDKTLYDD